MDFSRLTFEQRKRRRAERFGVATTSGEDNPGRISTVDLGDTSSSHELRRKRRDRPQIGENSYPPRDETTVAHTTKAYGPHTVSIRKTESSPLWLDHIQVRLDTICRRTLNHLIRVQDSHDHTPLPRRERRQRSRQV